MPLTASKTDADTSATTRLVTSGLVFSAMTALFMTPIHSSTWSGVAADNGRGVVASSATISISIALRALAPELRQRSNRKRLIQDLRILRIMCPPDWTEAALLRAGGQSAGTWQIARQQKRATVGNQLVGSRGEFAGLCMPFCCASQLNFLPFRRRGESSKALSPDFMDEYWSCG